MYIDSEALASTQPHAAAFTRHAHTCSVITAGVLHISDQVQESESVSEG